MTASSALADPAGLGTNANVEGIAADEKEVDPPPAAGAASLGEVAGRGIGLNVAFAPFRKSLADAPPRNMMFFKMFFLSESCIF